MLLHERVRVRVSLVAVEAGGIRDQRGRVPNLRLDTIQVHPAARPHVRRTRRVVDHAGIQIRRVAIGVRQTRHNRLRRLQIRGLRPLAMVVQQARRVAVLDLPRLNIGPILRRRLCHRTSPRLESVGSLNGRATDLARVATGHSSEPHAAVARGPGFRLIEHLEHRLVALRTRGIRRAELNPPRRQVDARIHRLNARILVKHRTLPDHLQHRHPSISRLRLRHGQQMHQRRADPRPRLTHRTAIRIPPVEHHRGQTLSNGDSRQERRLAPALRPGNHAATNHPATRHRVQTVEVQNELRHLASEHKRDILLAIRRGEVVRHPINDPMTQRRHLTRKGGLKPLGHALTPPSTSRSSSSRGPAPSYPATSPPCAPNHRP